MAEKLAVLWPEITLFIATCIVMVVGLSPSAAVRRMCGLITGVALAAAGILAIGTADQAKGIMPGVLPYAKAVIAFVGVLLTMLLAGVVDRHEEDAIAKGDAPFDPLRSTRGEFFSFFLFSMTGLMLCASADSLIWLFLALELTSLPTYVMVAMSSPRQKAKEAGVKYFFLGALGAAVFLYGFALIYGGTGSVHLSGIQAALASQAADGALNPIALTGFVIALLGVAFKIAAVPMHFYAADVYQGAASPVSAVLAFVPKTAGFLTIILLCAALGWNYGPDPIENGQLPEVVRVTLWVMAALTMFVGNVLAWLQSSVKRMLAYSSVAHSGYMLVGVIAGPGDSFTDSGIAAVLFYLLAYGIMNTGAFAVVSALETRQAARTATGELVHDEADDIAVFRGLCRRNPVLGWSMVVCALSLLGFPLTLGFFGKLPLFTAGIGAGEIPLVIVLGINSAIAAFYYLRLVALPLFEEPGDEAEAFVESPNHARRIAGVIAAGGVLVLTILASPLMDAAFDATTDQPLPVAEREPVIEQTASAD